MTVEAPAPAADLATGPTNTRRLVDVIFRVRELSLVGVLAVLVIATTASNSRFLSSQNLRDIGLNVAIIAPSVSTSMDSTSSSSPQTTLTAAPAQAGQRNAGASAAHSVSQSSQRSRAAISSSSSAAPSQTVSRTTISK